MLKPEHVSIYFKCNDEWYIVQHIDKDAPYRDPPGFIWVAHQHGFEFAESGSMGEHCYECRKPIPSEYYKQAVLIATLIGARSYQTV